MPVASPRLRMTISAAHVLKSIVKGIDNSFYPYLHPVSTCLHNRLPFSGNMLEFHFNRYANWFDYAFRLNYQYDAALLLRPGYEHLLSPSKDAFLYGAQNIWFEYDLPACPYPSFFIDLYRNERFCPAKAYRSLQQTARGFHYSANDKLLPFLYKLAENDLHTVYYGLMLSRADKPVRLTIEGIQPAQLTTALATIGWQGNYQLIDEVQKTFLPYARKVVLAIDFHDNLSSRIGIEVFSDRLDLLTDSIRGHMTPQQYAFVQSWEGVQLMEPALSHHLTLLHNRGITHIHKRINHVKWIIDNNRINTKAYLYYCF